MNDNDELPHILAGCSTCGYVFDMLNFQHCPACLEVRRQAVQEAFRPLNPLRTALGTMPGSFRVTKAGHVVPLDGSLEGYLDEAGDTMESVEALRREGLRIPRSAQEQIWQLRRLFRK